MTEEDQQVNLSTDEDTNSQYCASDCATDGEDLYSYYYFDSDDEDNDILTRTTRHQETQTLEYTRGINSLFAVPLQLQAFEQRLNQDDKYINSSTQTTEMATTQQLQEQLDQANASILTLQAQLNNTAGPSTANTATADLQKANNEIAELRAKILQMDGAGNELKKLVGRAPKVSTPDTFDGTRDKLKGYVTQVGTYMAFNKDLFQKEEEKVLYAASFLRGPAAAWFQPYTIEFMSDGPNGTVTAHLFATFENYLVTINQTFGTVNETQDAERNVMALKQLGAASTYTTKFMQYRAHLSWDETALCAAYYQGLKDHLKIELAKTERPTELSKLVDIVVNLDDRIYDAKKHAQGGAMRGPKTFRTDQRDNRGRFDSNYRAQTRGPSNDQARFTGARNGTYGGNYGPAPMELGAIQPKKTHQNQPKRDVKDVECYNCHEKGHYSRDCSKPRQERQQGRSNGRTHRPETYTRALHIIQKKLPISDSASPNTLDSSDDGQDPERRKLEQQLQEHGIIDFGWRTIDQYDTAVTDAQAQSPAGLLDAPVTGNAIDSSDSDGAHEWENPRYQQLEKSLPIKEEEEWLEAHPLRRGSIHHHYKRDKRGKLWQQFETKSPHKQHHSVRTRRVETTTKCTEEWCKNNGLRSTLGVSRWTFSTKCERSCSGFTCEKCHQQPQVASTNSLYAGTCGECRDNEERDKVARRMSNEGMISPNTDLQERIEQNALQQGGKAHRKQLQKLWRRKYGGRNAQLPLQWNKHTGEVTIVGSVQRIEKECDACFTQPAELATTDQRIHVCTGCAELWLKANGATQWLRIEPKN